MRKASKWLKLLLHRFKKEGNTIHNLALKESYDLDDPDIDPLKIATLLVQVNFLFERNSQAVGIVLHLPHSQFGSNCSK